MVDDSSYVYEASIFTPQNTRFSDNTLSIEQRTFP